MRNLSMVEGESGRRHAALRFRHELATALRNRRPWRGQETGHNSAAAASIASDSEAN
jgi:hypothetical protein